MGTFAPIAGCALPTKASWLIEIDEAIACGLETGTATEKRDSARGVTLARAVWDEAMAEQIASAVYQATVAIALHVT